MVPTKRLIRNIYIIIIGVLAIIGLIQGFWIFHAPLLTILIVELILMGAGAIGASVGWLVLRAIYPHLRGDDKKTAVGANMQANLLKEMQIEYKLNIDDALAFHSYNYEHSPQIGRARKLIQRMLLLAVGVELLVSIVLVAAFGKQQLPLATALFTLVVLTFLWYSFFPSLLRKSLRKEVARRHGQDQNKLTLTHRLSVTADTVTDVTDVGQSTTHWNAIEYVASTDQYLFMSVRASSPYIVPRRAFSDEALFSRFVEVAKAYHQAAVKEQA
jgi:hypothetical protein